MTEHSLSLHGGATTRDRALWALSVLVVLVHLSVAGRYGFFRDELYFIACGARPAWGYVDQPPLIPLLAWGWDMLMGGSLFGFRVLPAVCAGALVWVTGALARELGGGTRAALLGGVAVAVGPIFLIAGHLFTMLMLEPLLWTLVVLSLAKQLDERATPRRWLWLGLLVGLGLCTKYSMAFWVVCLTMGLVFSPARRVLASRWPLAAAAIAGALVLPSVLWQAAHDWPFLELLRAGQLGKNAPFEALGFSLEVVLLAHPVAAPLWLLGSWQLFRKRRWLGLAALIFLGLMFVLKAKPYYVAPVFPTLLAAGAAALERSLSSWRAGRVGSFALLVSSGLVTAPLAIPLLAVERLIPYQRMLGFKPPPLENKEYGELPQHFADQFGWPEIGAAAREAFQLLPAADQARAAVFTLNYGDAAAIARFGGVPAISGHNQYAEFGPAPADGSVLLVFGSSPKELQPFFGSIQRVGTGPSSPFMMPYERGRPIWLVREPKLPLEESWRLVRHID